MREIVKGKIGFEYTKKVVEEEPTKEIKKF